MRVVFRTNLDNYQTNCWPYDIPFVPRVGEYVSVSESLKDYFRNKKLPTTLVVTSVTYEERLVVVELWYRKSDIEAAEIKKINLF